MKNKTFKKFGLNLIKNNIRINLTRIFKSILIRT